MNLIAKNFFVIFISFLRVRVVCKCGFCGTEKQQLSDWERHTGSKVKNWKKSIRVKGSMLPLEQWVCASIVLQHFLGFMVPIVGVGVGYASIELVCCLWEWNSFEGFYHLFDCLNLF